MKANPLESDQWATPDDLFHRLDREFEFDFDLCASEFNAKTPFYSTDILKHVDYVWKHGAIGEGRYWMNPPYSRGNIEVCMGAMVRLLDHPETKCIVTLTRFDPSTAWFQEFVDGVANEVRMLAHRVKFKGAKDSYNFPCCVAVYEPYYNKTNYKIWSWKDD